MGKVAQRAGFVAHPRKWDALVGEFAKNGGIFVGSCGKHGIVDVNHVANYPTDK